MFTATGIRYLTSEKPQQTDFVSLSGFLRASQVDLGKSKNRIQIIYGYVQSGLDAVRNATVIAKVKRPPPADDEIIVVLKDNQAGNYSSVFHYLTL